MKTRKLLVLSSAAVLLAASGFGQGYFNEGTSPNLQVMTTQGGLVSPNATAPILGAGALTRAAGSANLSYINTGVAYALSGPWTMEYWIRPAALAVSSLAYLLGDSTAVFDAANGPFRTFTNGNNSNNNNLVLRGFPNQPFTAPTPGGAASTAPGVLTVGVATHVTFAYDPTASTFGTIYVYVNGVLNGTFAQTAALNHSLTNLTFAGYNGSSSNAMPGEYDEFQFWTVYRTPAQVLADYNTQLAAPNLPQKCYGRFDGVVNQHNLTTSINGDPEDKREKRFTDGTLVTWTANSPGLPGSPYSVLLNYNQGGLSPTCSTSFGGQSVAGLQVCNGFSTPIGAAIEFPDSLHLTSIGVAAVNIPIAANYGTSPGVIIPVPAPFFTPGDSLFLQSIALDPGYPLYAGTSNPAKLVYDPGIPGEHFSFEAKGVSNLQVTGFWRMRNTGTIPISSIELDFVNSNPTLPYEFYTNNVTNSGGTLQCSTAYRENCIAVTGCVPTATNTLVTCSPAPPAGQNFIYYTGTNVGTNAGTFRTMAWNFNLSGSMFDGPTDDFVFDAFADAPGAGVAPNAHNGAAYAGMRVTVNFITNVQLQGFLAQDPSNPDRTFLSL